MPTTDYVGTANTREWGRSPLNWPNPKAVAPGAGWNVYDSYDEVPEGLGLKGPGLLEGSSAGSTATGTSAITSLTSQFPVNLATGESVVVSTPGQASTTFTTSADVINSVTIPITSASPAYSYVYGVASISIPSGRNYAGVTEDAVVDLGAEGAVDAPNESEVAEDFDTVEPSEGNGEVAAQSEVQ